MPTRTFSQDNAAEQLFTKTNNSRMGTPLSSVGQQLSMPLANRSLPIEDAWAAYVAVGGYTSGGAWLTYQDYYAIAANEPDAARVLELVREVENKG
jgi:hypothetical protein